MNIVFVKTAKGSQAIAQRSDDMSLRTRRILILIDGKRTVEDIQALVLADDLNRVLADLEKGGYVEPLKQAGAVTVPVRGEDGAMPSFTFRPIPGNPDPKDIEKARHFIMNTLTTFCGPMTHLRIVKAVAAAQTHEELRENFLPWYDAIVETRGGRNRSDELCTLLLEVI